MTNYNNLRHNFPPNFNIIDECLPQVERNWMPIP